MQQLSVDAFSQKIGTRITSMKNISIFPVVSTRDNQFPDIYNYLSNPKQSDLSKETVYRNTSSRANELMSTQPGLTDMFILDLDLQGIAIQKYQQYHIISCTEYNDTFTNAYNARGGHVLYAGETISLPFLRPNTQPLVLIRAIVSSQTYEPIGYIGTVVEIADIARSFQKQTPYSSTAITVFDNNGRYLWGANSPKEASSLFQQIPLSQEAQNSFRAEGFLCTYQADPDLGIVCLITSSEAEINQAFISQEMPIILIPFIILLISFLFILYLICRFNESIFQMTTACEALRQGQYSITLEMPAESDLQPMVHAFNEMADQIDYLVNEVYSQTMMTQRLEIQMLRNQINPHFLYNTLESLRMRAYTAEQYELSEMLTLLGNLFRYSVDTLSEETTVNRELQYIQNYVKLQQLRYDDLFSLHLHCDVSLGNCKLPKMLIQPIIENAIVHGFSSLAQHGRIDVMVYKENADLKICISDNGGGMESAQLETLISCLDNELEFSGHVGLRNVHRRIQLTYGKTYGITIRSILNRGTVVTLTLPLQKETNHE